MIDMRIKDLKKIIKNLPDDMVIVIPVINELNSNDILGFRLVRTAGVLEDKNEKESKVFCLSSSADNYDLADQIHFSGRDVSVLDVNFGKSKFDKE